MRRTKEEAAETSRQILEAAERLFLEKGYESVSLEEIATQCDVTRGAVHWHFKNKHGLLLALRDQAQEPFRLLANDLSAGRSVASLDRLGDVIADVFSRLQKDPRHQGILRVMIRLDLAKASDDTANGSAFPEEMEGWITSIFEAVERDAGLAKPWTPSVAAAMLNATVGGLVLEWALRKAPFRLAPDAAMIVRTVLAGMKKQPG
ncbi:TetR family transcriptional regulator [Agrobacterium larrymoorei]|uniref:TetR family transcriptional regulator n=1 Tax=Agrobacterium larrymoorei TaxID=160699 RepID=A0A4D7E3B6_9HYPH|nr:TetR family transcriptional regulator [Agrobacterium larrymoorei]QCJ00657.1 TetR family transcriptional regulator [Agrobacterium larrymoorei]QYA10655.1 TetR family transcriptional regulator [Agrobacterium larrymoorei]